FTRTPPCAMRSAAKVRDLKARAWNSQRSSRIASDGCGGSSPPGRPPLRAISPPAWLRRSRLVLQRGEHGKGAVGIHRLVVAGRPGLEAALGLAALAAVLVALAPSLAPGLSARLAAGFPLPLRALPVLAFAPPVA